MTLPDERFRAVRMARLFLEELMLPGQTPKVPKAVRSRARSILKHYPGDWDMECAAEAAPTVFQKEMEPVSRLFKQYEENKKNAES